VNGAVWLRKFKIVKNFQKKNEIIIIIIILILKINVTKSNCIFDFETNFKAA